MPNSTSKPKRNRRIDLTIWSDASDEEVGMMLNTIWYAVFQAQTRLSDKPIEVHTSWAGRAAMEVAAAQPGWRPLKRVS